MEDQILRFTEQFGWTPAILHSENLPTNLTHTIVCGMGGSHLGARLLLRHDPTLPITIHSDYGLPRESARRLRTALVVISSYSGETEEALDAARAAVEDGLAVAVVTTGGILAEYARAHSFPLIIVPSASVESRMAVGASMLALARLMRDSSLETLLKTVGNGIKVEMCRADGEELAKSLAGSIPVIYASTLNSSLAYFWKIAFNETGKIPAFYNLFPEVCHNELSGYDTAIASSTLTSPLHIVILNDTDDHPRIAKRMQIMRDILVAKNMRVSVVPIPGSSGIEKSFNGILLGAWTALTLAHMYKAPDASTPLIEEFKKRMLDV